MEHGVSKGVGVPECACTGQRCQEHRVRLICACAEGVREHKTVLDLIRASVTTAAQES